MDLHDDQNRTSMNYRDLEPSHLWVIGVANDAAVAVAPAPADRPTVSFRTECICPGDCLRDHEID